MRCSKPIENETEEFCLDCKRHHFSYDSGFAVFLYSGKLKDSVLRFKYAGRQEYSGFYGQMMNLFASGQVKRWNPDVLMPVPVHRAKLAKRGYNQAQVLAETLGKMWNIPVDGKTLKRKKNTRAQKELDPKERKRNLREAFVLEGKINYHTVILIDDIYTTGSTVDVLAGLLKTNGVKKVCFLTLCIGKGF
jgi:ComF family protein